MAKASPKEEKFPAVVWKSCMILPHAIKKDDEIVIPGPQPYPLVVERVLVDNSIETSGYAVYGTRQRTDGSNARGFHRFVDSDYVILIKRGRDAGLDHVLAFVPGPGMGAGLEKAAHHSLGEVSEVHRGSAPLAGTLTGHERDLAENVPSAVFCLVVLEREHAKGAVVRGRQGRRYPHRVIGVVAEPSVEVTSDRERDRARHGVEYPDG
jgi:hypothetical protein